MSRQFLYKKEDRGIPVWKRLREDDRMYTPLTDEDIEKRLTYLDDVLNRQRFDRRCEDSKSC